ncbi:nitrous oxide reductase accessory protein NosL [Pontibacter liquoris]|uniref:nitrous oxide reductase accessory protein NosL n=1 Tax=Pontibacter liquoris TaxID=2905677 RepID=UPI001FA6B404|nr:nitrous oxide reductase accessory protein NosL [Pontibacter liquoris]
MKTHFTLVWGICLWLLISCQVAPKPIAYGQVNCAHCNMTVSDSRFGAELVSAKGKVYTFDSAECLAAYLNDNPGKKKDAAYVLVTDFSNPKQLVDARKATFLQSAKLASPMGMSLTAFADNATAGQFRQQHQGRLLTWEQTLLVVQKNEKPQ